MIYATDGSVASKAIVPMSWSDLAWLNDGHQFLRHLNDFAHLRLQVICHWCHGKGREDSIRVRVLHDQQEYIAECAHAHRRIPFAGVTSGDELRNLYRWALRCRAPIGVSDCERLGMHYWVDGQNERTEREMHLQCGCADRVWKRAHVA